MNKQELQELIFNKLNVTENDIVSIREKTKNELWSKLENCSENNIEVEGVIFGSIKGGYTVDICGIIAFLPSSHVDLRQIKDISTLLGIKQKFLIIKIDKNQENIIVSRKAILETYHINSHNKYLEKLQEGEIIQGKIKSITNYGVFVEIHKSKEVGVVDGFLNIIDISWNHINHPSTIFSCKQEIHVKIIKIDKNTGKIYLGVKQLEDNRYKNR